MQKQPWFRKLVNTFTGKPKTELDTSFWENVEDLLLEGDIAISLVNEMIKTLKNSSEDLSNSEILKNELKKLLNPHLLSAPIPYEDGKMNLYFILGINGAGKTTTLAKMARYFQVQGHSDILFCAGDTFRAAAGEQLRQHAQSLGIRAVSQKEGSDPASVLWDALSSAQAKGENIVLIDTAGRLHNKAYLIEELKKMVNVSSKVLKETPFVQHNILILDAHMGQNAREQARIFGEAFPLTGFILSKFDSSSRSGVVLSLCDETGLPFLALGQGETREDLTPFETDRFLDKLLAP